MMITVIMMMTMIKMMTITVIMMMMTMMKMVSFRFFLTHCPAPTLVGSASFVSVQTSFNKMKLKIKNSKFEI